MSTESQQRIAREAAKDAYADAHLYKDPTRIEHIILSAIERATEFHSLRWNALQKAQHNMRDPERKMVCDILANGSTSAQPQLSDTELARQLGQQEWTEIIREIHGMIPDADKRDAASTIINAALTAERQRREQAERLYAAHVDGFDRDEIITGLRQQLLSALAAIEENNEEMHGTQFVIDVDLSPLHKHDEKLTAEVRKTLVDLLEQAYHKLLYSNYRTLAKSIRDALAKVKDNFSTREGKGGENGIKQ